MRFLRLKNYCDYYFIRGDAILLTLDVFGHLELMDGWILELMF